ncbi:MAG TPA: urate hydroxylase PuuD [Candidatus Eisenbacteria bacterium]|nr:urate hydroxylase PuuD [Candidatus Eisenbacteria bacterium]
MDVMELLQALFRWIHIVAGITWIGLLYFLNFVNGPFEGTLDGGAKKTVVPQLRPRVFYWFRWGAAWTWITGVLLLLLVFYHGQIVYDAGGSWNLLGIIMVAVTFLAFVVYDPIAKMDFAKNNKQMAGVGFALVVLVVLGYHQAGFGYRAYVIHLGALFGTIMAANVWMRIWPSQQKIITAIRDGQAPDAALVALAGQRSRHNTYMSVALVWTMINSHTTVPFASSFVWLLVMVAIAWSGTMLLYKKAAAVKGF